MACSTKGIHYGGCFTSSHSGFSTISWCTLSCLPDSSLLYEKTLIYLGRFCASFFLAVPSTVASVKSILSSLTDTVPVQLLTPASWSSSEILSWLPRVQFLVGCTSWSVTLGGLILNSPFGLVWNKVLLNRRPDFFLYTVEICHLAWKSLGELLLLPPPLETANNCLQVGFS